MTEARAVEVHWEEMRLNWSGDLVLFFVCATRNDGDWTFEERSTWENRWFPVARERREHYRQKAEQVFAAPLEESPVRAVHPAVEVGNFHDNQAVLAVALRQIEQGDFDEATRALSTLEDHITTSSDPKSETLLLAVQDALRTARAGLRDAERASADDLSRAPAAERASTSASQLAADPVRNWKGDLLDASVLLAAAAYAIGLVGHELAKLVPVLAGSTFAANAVAASLLTVALYLKRSSGGRLRDPVVSTRACPSAAP